MRNVIAVVVLMLISFALGVSLAPYFSKSETKSTAVEKKILYWVAPMDPNYRRDKPGKSPMGMDLVAVYEKGHDSEKDDSATIKISSHVINKLGVKTNKAIKRPIRQVINTVGLVKTDEENIESISVYIDGWVRNLRVNAIGEKVIKGQVLFDLYSPALIQAQQEYLLALSSHKQDLIKAGEKKLLTLGLSRRQIKRIERTKEAKENIHVFTNKTGILSTLNIRDGMYVKPNSTLMLIEDLSFVWVRGSVYEKDASLITLNQKAVATFRALPGIEWLGQVSYIYPKLDKQTHTLSIRIRFPNPELLLKPNMYANIRIMVTKEKESILIPKSSVIPIGNETRVILSLGNGEFKPQKVVLGVEEEDFVEVLSGIRGSDVVVSSGHFLIDSESNLNASFKRLTPNKKGHAHHHHHMKHKQKKSIKKETLNGEILSIDRAKKRVTFLLCDKFSLMQKKPKTIMEVMVSPEINLENFNKKEKVEVIIVERENNQYELVEMTSISKKNDKTKE